VTLSLQDVDVIEENAARALCCARKAVVDRLYEGAAVRSSGSVGVPEAQRKMRVQQLWHWIYFRGFTSFEEMTSVSKELRNTLAERFTLARPEVVAEQVSVDGTRKWLLRLPGEVQGERPHEVECVYIPDTERGTLCVSSQVGLHAQLQLLPHGHAASGEEPDRGRNRRPDHDRARIASVIGRAERGRPMVWCQAEDRCITNIVMMGMGEPLYNFDAVRDALLIVADGEGIAISKRRITLSTSGVVPNIERTGAEIGCMLAVSLHAVPRRAPQ
jgi:23S rRNA (adenine2503-C2)-methyltransferase